MSRKKGYFKPVPPKIDFPELEEKILKFWQKNKIFEKSIKQRSAERPYSFYDGPPFITGLPHYGHLTGSIAKDLIPRYQTMKGKRIRRVWGWDCHGLPVEEKTERKLGLANRRAIEKIGIKRFVKECRIYVSETSAEWNWYINRIARWVDMENAYKTMDLHYMESVIWAFKKLYDQGLVYKGLKTLLYCSRCGTPVSKFEIAMDDSYADMEDPAVTVEFPIVSPGKFQGVRVLAWTTTPWTLPSNRALVIDPGKDYILFKSKDPEAVYLAARERLKAVLKEDRLRMIKKVKGAKLIGLSYLPPFDYFPSNSKDFKIYAFPGMVNMEEGTGIVHSAPGFGEIDTRMGLKYGLTMMFSVDDEGKFVKEVKDFKGLYVKKADPLIIDNLKKRNLLFRSEKIVHRYPYCYRCRTPLLQKAVKAWFVRVKKIKKRMLILNKNVNWVPAHFKEGRFKNIIAEAPDWCLSRTRYWATVMPIWECEKCRTLKVVGSVKEIEENSTQPVKITDLHRPAVDPIVFKCPKCQGLMRRIPEVLDVWFESASMPYGERHYPFENKAAFEKSFPADYIVEYTGQLRAWFYYLHVLSTALFDSNCFKNVVVTGVMAGTDGRKMSKSFGNYPDPREVLEKYGGDALRLYLMGTRLMVGEDINITKGEELYEQVKNTLLPFWHSYKFLVTQALLFRFKPEKKKLILSQTLNRWLKARTQQFINQTDQFLSSYQIPQAVRLIRPLIEDLSTWYIRRSRDNLSRGDGESLQLLYQVLEKLSRASAPIMPFITEAIYQNLFEPFCPKGNSSVHLCDFPKLRPLTKFEKDLLVQMDLVREICSRAHAIRKKKNLKVRQPLSRLSYYWPEKLGKSLEKLIAEEVNVKEVVWKEKMAKIPGVRLVTRLNGRLIAEGKARDLIRAIQKLRKEAGCRLDEPVEVVVPQIPRDRQLVKMIQKKTLVRKLVSGKELAVKRF
ncbi:MAG: isoleucine--tRNA ligase [Candidatus Pacebacteria bacterium]|nr:isoleucine--tRNA ligase [Candidatus Paceibacterota bacterium]